MTAIGASNYVTSFDYIHAPGTKDSPTNSNPDALIEKCTWKHEEQTCESGPFLSMNLARESGLLALDGLTESLPSLLYPLSNMGKHHGANKGEEN